MSAEVLDELTQEMERTLASLRGEFSKVRTGRASTALIEGVMVPYYGSPTPLQQIASLSAPEARLLIVQPYEKNLIGDVEKAVYQADLGLAPINDGKVIRIPIPELTQERRQEFVRKIRKIAEEYRVSMRNHRRDANDLLKVMQKDKDITEDELHTSQERVQKVTDEYIEKLDRLLKLKEDELMSV